jgi:hypothetical protein
MEQATTGLGGTRRRLSWEGSPSLDAGEPSSVEWEFKTNKRLYPSVNSIQRQRTVAR